MNKNNGGHIKWYTTYLLLSQLFFQSLAVSDGHSLDLLLPLLGVVDPADQPVVALAIVAQLAAELLKLSLTKVHLWEHGLPAVLEAGQELAVVVQLSVTLAVHAGHLVAHGSGLLQLCFQRIKHWLFALSLGSHFLQISYRIKGCSAESTQGWKSRKTRLNYITGAVPTQQRGGFVSLCMQVFSNRCHISQPTHLLNSSFSVVNSSVKKWSKIISSKMKRIICRLPWALLCKSLLPLHHWGRCEPRAGSPHTAWELPQRPVCYGWPFPQSSAWGEKKRGVNKLARRRFSTIQFIFS